MKKRLFTIFLISSLLITTTGCEHTIEVVEKDTTTDMMQVNDDTDISIGIPSLTQELSVEDESFKLLCEYNTGSYPINNWHVTDSKSITMKVKTKNLPEGYEVYIDHVHADISLKSTLPGLNGITQDSMDDTFHGYSQDGFYINNDDEYYNIFAIEGYTDQFYQLWGYAVGEYGAAYSTYQRMTEQNIVEKGETYAEKLMVVYDLSIKKPGSDKLYTKSVLSEILIPVSTDIKTVTKELFTGNIIEDSTME